MALLENIMLSISGLLSNKLRSVLTMLGIIIGISSVITITTIGTSIKKSVALTVSQFGVNDIYVYLQQNYDNIDNDNFEFVEPTKDDMISDDMIKRLREKYPDEIKAISAEESVGSGIATDKDIYSKVDVNGVTDGYFTSSKLELISGRFITERDSTEKRKVAVVSDKFANTMFPDSSPINQPISIKINDSDIVDFYIVGVYRYDVEKMGYNANVPEKDISTPFYIPINTAKKMNGGTSGYQYLTVVASEEYDANLVLNDVQNFFNDEYADNDNFEIYTYGMQSDLDQVNKMLSAVTIAVSAIAAISLLVGGIGVMNIMLVSITERTKEIGIRKALGAKNSAIRMQFIVEAMLICLIGGIIGITIGVICGCAASNVVMNYMMDGDVVKSVTPPVDIILIAVGFSMLIGVFFGYYPANKAAKMNPIDALRYE